MTLIIMAAGIGSRFGGGIKQLQKVDKNGHIIMDYSIHDAISAGFNKIVFIIRRDIEDDFKTVIGDRISDICKSLGVKVEYAYQEMPDPKRGRTKPYGTCHAVLSCKNIVNEPFAVINADDFYGKGSFKLIGSYLMSLQEDSKKKYCIAGFVLKNTLSDNGGVTRGICKLDENGHLSEITEVKNIIKVEGGAVSDGKTLELDSPVSMNMWGFTPDFFELLENGFSAFMDNVGDDKKAEFLLPTFIGKLLEEKTVAVKVLPCNDRWFGMTYKEDIPTVAEEFSKLLSVGIYNELLYSDLK